jgi:hypothetical protein
MGLIWLIALALLAFTLFVAYRFVSEVSEGRDTTSVVVIVVLVLGGVAVGACSPLNTRLWHKLTGSRVQSRETDAALDELDREELVRTHRIDPEFRNLR